jgi:glucosamine--fructose-6-phosphate aminotransferase (isomerizing)
VSRDGATEAVTPLWRPADLRARVATTTTWREATTAGEAIDAALGVARAAPDAIGKALEHGRRIVVTGAGSSFYVAQVAASTMRQVGHLPAVAVPLSDVLLRPGDVFAPDPAADQPVIVVSRSGSTTEAVDAVRSVRERHGYVLAVTCRPGSPMTAPASDALSIPEADEQAIVMTRSFAAMVTLLMRLGTRMGDPALGNALDRLPARWSETAPHVEHAFELATARPSRVAILGGGAAHGLANEAALKLTETSQIPASAFHPLEFRHGPISVCEPGVLVIGLLGGSTEEVERRVLEDCAALGATTWSLGPEGPAADLGEVAQLPLVLHPLQALALGIAVERGLDPDHPRHLAQVVVIRET